METKVYLVLGEEDVQAFARETDAQFILRADEAEFIIAANTALQMVDRNRPGAVTDCIYRTLCSCADIDGHPHKILKGTVNIVGIAMSFVMARHSQLFRGLLDDAVGAGVTTHNLDTQAA
jgi:hypothetical protein